MGPFFFVFRRPQAGLQQTAGGLGAPPKLRPSLLGLLSLLTQRVPHDDAPQLKAHLELTARPEHNPRARSLRRALLMTQVNLGSLYGCGKGT